jgi:hypothetical protein
MKYGVLSFLGIIIVGLIIQVLVKFEIFKEDIEVTRKYKNCRYVDDITPGPEDIVRYDATTLIFGSGDLINLFERGDPDSTNRGQVYVIINAH